MTFILVNLFGGIGLLLVGMSLMTDGLKLASGKALREILAMWTNTRLRGLFSGFLVTGIVQSSTAVTVATIGFANTGMLTLDRAVWVIYGSNVGTTMTAWIVALAGFQLNIDALALPLIGFGALLRFSGARTKRSSYGLALIGFGLLFLGIGFLKETFDNLGSDFTLPTLDGSGLAQMAIYMATGFLLTTVTQSSSASTVITLSAAQGGLIPLDAAAAIVIGANLGTTTTALITVAGATANAKRVAISHVLFNLITAIVALFILKPILLLAQWLETSLGLIPSPAVTLAFFHTLFNVLGVLLMWPLSGKLVQFMEGRFKSPFELEAKPRHLDKSVLALPFIAADAIALEVMRVNHLTLNAFRSSLRYKQEVPHNVDEHAVVRKLADAIASYSVELGSHELTPFLSETLAKLIESTQQYLLVIDIVEDLAELSQSPREKFHRDVSVALDEYIDCIMRHLDEQDLAFPERNTRSSASYDSVELYYRKLKDAILHSAARGELSMERVDRLLQYNNQAKRASRQTLKATQRLLVVRDALQPSLHANGNDESTVDDDAHFAQSTTTTEAQALTANADAEEPDVAREREALTN